MSITLSNESDCCNQSFEFNIVNLHEVAKCSFYYAGGTNIIITYVKDDYLYFSISYNSGKIFEPPEKIMNIGGIVTDIQILSKEDQFVVALKIQNRESKEEIKKAVSGWIYNEKRVGMAKSSSDFLISKRNKFCYKPCTIQKNEGMLLNTSLSFRTYKNNITGELEEESVDHSFILGSDGKIIHQCQGHACITKT